MREQTLNYCRKEINKFSADSKITFAELKIDCRIKPRAFTIDAVKALKSFEPYGANNPNSPAAPAAHRRGAHRCSRGHIPLRRFSPADHRR